MVTGVEHLLRRTIGEHVALSTLLRTPIPQVLADPGQLEQVLVNLAVNARDAMSGGGIVTIETSDVDVDADYAAFHPGITAGRFARLRMTDSGAGMPEEVLQHAFEPFFTTKAKGEGSGLGLATVYGIITQAGGYVRLYSEPGRGTTFTALLPATEQKAGAAESHRPVGRHRGVEAVLVVEDEEAIREITRRILDRNGYRVLVAGSGVEAIAIARDLGSELDLLLTDVIMPQMLGKEVAEHIVDHHPAVRVLFMSGYAQPVLASQGTLEHGVTLVEKPFSEARLLEKVRQVLDGDDGPAAARRAH